ncbi:unnamed protein product [Penicillium pancosmium]
MYMCHYAGPQRMTKKHSQGIQHHLRELETQIGQLSATNSQQYRQAPVGAVLVPQQVFQPSREILPEPTFPGTMQVNQDGQDGTRYVDPTHWQAVLHQIAEVKEYLQLTEDTSPEEEEDENPCLPEISGPVLLFGNAISASKDDLLDALPARAVADRLVSSYLNSKEATLGLQLFSTAGRVDGDLSETFAEYHRIASQCLTMSNYTSPGRYKMEAVILNVAMEILRSTDNHVGPSVLLGLASRLAMHSGYHRDSKHYREISVFDGEMRRRVWMSLRLLDHYISLQAGLPPSTTQVQTDTEEPRNLLDEDLDPSMTTLLPSRPSTEITPMLFPVTLNRMMFMGAEIMSKVCSVKGVPYNEVLHLDAKLKELHTMIPLPLRYRTMSESIADSPNTIMDRYNIDLIYQKCRGDLHRRYLAQHRMDPAFAYSRKECLDAARAVLQHQSDIFESSSVSSFFFSPIVATHFRSAAMIVSLEISCQSRYDLKQNLSLNDRQAIINERYQLSQEIERAYNIWNQLRQQSKEASKMAQALSIMLKVTNTHLQHGDTPEQVGLLGSNPEFQDGEHLTMS